MDEEFLSMGTDDTEDEGPALPGWNPTGEMPERTWAQPEIPDITPEEPAFIKSALSSGIDWSNFERDATPEENKAAAEWFGKREKYGRDILIDELFNADLRRWQTNPAEAARRLGLERDSGIPANLMDNPAILRRAERQVQYSMGAAALRTAPESVVEWLSTPGMMEIAHDDLETMAAIGNAMQDYARSLAPERVGSVWDRFRRGFGNVFSGKADVLEMRADQGKDGDVTFTNYAMNYIVDETKTHAPERSLRQLAGEWREWAEWANPEPFMNAGGLWGVVGDIAEGMPYTLSGMPLSWALTAGGAIAGGPLGAHAGALLSSFISSSSEAETEQAQVYHQLVGNGMDKREAYEKSYWGVYLPNLALLTFTNYAENIFSFGGPIVPVGPGVRGWLLGAGKSMLFGKADPLNPLAWWKRGWNFALSSGMEGVEEIAQGLISNRALGEENDWGELAYEGFIGVANGLIFSGVGNALNLTLSKMRENRAGARNAARARAAGERLEAAVNAARASKVLERAPEVMKEFARYVTDNNVRTVTMDAETFKQSMGPEAEAAAEKLGITEGLNEALATGGDVEIETAELIANPEIHEKVKRDLRLEEDGMSINEAEEWQKHADENQKALADDAAKALETVREAGEEAARVQESFRAQLEALGQKTVTKSVADMASVLYTAGVVNEARAAGISITEMANRPEWNIRFMFDREARARVGENYNQIIGERGAASLDAADATNAEGKGLWQKLLLDEASEDFHKKFGEYEDKIEFEFLGLDDEELAEKLRVAEQEFRDSLSKEDLAIYDKYLEAEKEEMSKRRNAEEKRRRAYEKYNALSGEVEARNTENRMDMSAEERRAKLLEETEDVAREDQIILRDALGRSESYAQTMPDIPETQLDAVRKRYEGTPQWMKAPNGKDTNLDERQWLQVRTPAFKKWFGDWEAAATAREIRDMEATPVTALPERMTQEDAEAKAGSFGEMTNKRYGVTATMPKGTVGKIFGHKGFNVTQIFNEVPRLFETSVLALSETSDGHKQRNNVNAYHHFVNKFKVDGKEYYIRFTAYELNEKKPTGKRSIHSTAISEVEVYAANKKTSSLGRSGSIGPGVKEQTSFIDQKIAQILAAVNNASKVVDENGEPLVVYHGTNSDFSVFDINMSGKTTNNKGIFGNGFYMTNLSRIAQNYQGKMRPNYENGKGKVMGLFANIKNPFYWNSSEGYKIAAELGFPKSRMREGKLLPLTNDSAIMKFTKQLKENGYDGVIYSEPDEQAGVYHEVVAFNSEQIKSATDNAGTFDAGNPDTYQQGKGRTERGYVEFRETETVIHILQHGDRSTLIHELGHVFLNSRRRLAQMEGVTEFAKNDWKTLSKWLDIEDIDFSKPLSEADEKRWRSAHEKFAAGFEKYVMEGKAPTTELARAFRAFRKWMCDIYKAVKNVLYIDADGNAQGFEISDEVRAVMDRMLASEEEIENSQAMRDAEKLSRRLKKQGIPDDVAARYRDRIDAAADAAKAKLMKKLTSELKREKQDELKQARKDARKRVAAEVWEMPEYKALKALRRPTEKGGIRLSLPDLMTQYGEAEAKKLANALPFGVVANDGLNVEEAASLLGYPAGEALIEDLKKAKETPPAKAISERVKAETAELESLINNPEELRAEAERLLHGTERADWLAMEAAMLNQAAGNVKEQIIKEARQEEKKQEQARQQDDTRSRERMFSAENLAAWTKAAEETAKRIIAGKRIKDISAARYMGTERRAAERALQAAAAGKFNEAYQWKRTELLNHALAAEALRVREEYDRGRRYLNKFWSNRKRLRGAIGNGAFDQIISLLTRLGVNQEDPKVSKDKPRLSAYLNKLADEESGLWAPQWILDLEARDERLSINGLTMERFNDALEMVKGIEHVGRLEKSLLTEQETRNFEEAVARLTAATEEAHGLPGPQSIDPNQEGVGLFAGYFASLDRVETLLKKADGLKEQGAWWKTFYRPAQRAFEAEIEKAKAAKAALDEIYKKHFPDKKAFAKFLTEKQDTGLIDPGTGKKLYWTGENILAAMLNWGNQHNRERLVFGQGFVDNALQNYQFKPADDAQYYQAYQAGASVVEALFGRVANDEMWAFCQDVWDLIDTFWPEIKALEEKMTGAAPEKVEATTVTTASGKKLRGGYYPVKFNANADWKAFLSSEKENARALYENQGRPAATRHGHTKERVERIAGRQLSLSLNVIDEHLNNVIHDLTHRPLVRDLTKLIKDDRVRGLLNHAVGRAGFQQFNPWIQALASPSTPTDPIGRVMSKLMGNAAAVGLGFNIISMVGQTVSLVPAAWKLGLRDVLPAIADTLTLRGLWDAKWRDAAFALSAELADRINGTDRDIRAALELERSGAGKKLLSGAKAAMYIGMGWMDMAVSLPVWSAAYDKGLKLFGGDTQRAVDYADGIIRQTNNTGAVKDLAQAQRGTVFKKLFTMYYSAFGSMYQMFREEMTRAGRTGLPGKIRLAAFCFMMFGVQAALEDILKGRAPWNDDDWDEEEKGTELLKWMLQGGLGSFSSMFPIWRDVASGTKALGGFGEYRPSPALDAGTTIVRAIDSAAGAIGKAWNGEDVEAERTVKDLFRAGGYAFGLPTTQLLRWYKTFCRWSEGAPDYSPLELIYAKRGK